MATQQNFDDDEEEQQGQAGGEQVLSGESSQMGQGGAPGQGGQQAQQAPQSKSGSWTNLLDYVGANQGNDAQMGNKIKTGIGGRASDAESSGQAYNQRASDNIAAGSVVDNGIIDGIKTNAKDVAANQQDQFKKQWDAYYQGPESATDVEGYNEAGQKYQGVQERAQNAQTHDGRKTLLDDEYNRPTYSKGEKTLDSFILGAGEQGRQSLNDINQTYGNYASGWDNLINQVGGNIQQGKATTDQTRENTRNAVTSGIGNSENQLQGIKNQYGNNASQWDKQFSDLQGNLQKDASAYGEVGIDPEVAEFLKGNGFGLGNIVNRTNPKYGDFVSDDQIDQYKALLDLGGTVGNQDLQDFERSGTQNFYSRNDDLINLGRQAQGSVAAAAAKAKQEQDSIKKFLSSREGQKELLTTRLGRDATRDQRVIENGLDLNDFIKFGDQNRSAFLLQDKGWNDLISKLSPHGFNYAIDDVDKNFGAIDKKPGWSFDERAYIEERDRLANQLDTNFNRD